MSATTHYCSNLTCTWTEFNNNLETPACPKCGATTHTQSDEEYSNDEGEEYYE